MSAIRASMCRSAPVKLKHTLPICCTRCMTNVVSQLCAGIYFEVLISSHNKPAPSFRRSKYFGVCGDHRREGTATQREHFEVRFLRTRRRGKKKFEESLLAPSVSQYALFYIPSSFFRTPRPIYIECPFTCPSNVPADV